MTMPIDNTMAGYMVYRDSPVDQPFDGTAPLAFFPPKDSDELFDALRAQFPHLKTHSERMREATIAYLMQERADEQSPAPLPTPQTIDTAMTSPWLASFPSMSTDSSNFSSPEMLGLATPSFSDSPQPQHYRPNISRQSVVAPNSTTPPALEQMTGVFSLSESSQPKQRVRRKMTEAEKAEYRKRRIVKACDKCSKRKRKCVHNQPEMESLAKSTHKVEKSKPAAHQKKPGVIPLSLSPDPALDSISASQPFIQGDEWLDFTLLDDPMPEMSFDDLLQVDLDRPLKNQQYLHFQQPWGADEDFAAILRNEAHSQSTFDGQTMGNGLAQQQGLLFDDLQPNAGSLSFTTGNKKYPVGVQPRQQLQGGDCANGLLWNDLDVHQDVLGQGTHEQHVTRQQHTCTPDTQNVESGDAMFFDSHFEGVTDDPSSYSGETAPRKELTRNIKNPMEIDVLQHFFDGGDRSIHQSESTSKNRNDRFNQANEQNRTNVRSVEGSGTKDLMQAADLPYPRTSRREDNATHRKSSRSEDNATHPRSSRSEDNATASHGHATGDGHTRDPTTELYLLRRGATSSLRNIPQTQQVTSNRTTPNLTGLSAILPATGAEKPARTRDQNPTVSPISNDPYQAGNDSMQAGTADESAISHSSRPRAHGRSSAATAQSVTATPESSVFYQERLHDTVRYRDHFGRLALAICAAVFGAVLLFCAAQNSSLSISTLLLAAFAPASSDSLMGIMGKRRWKSYRKTAGGGEASNGKADKFFGWTMTPHSSLRWSVRNE